MIGNSPPSSQAFTLTATPGTTVTLQYQTISGGDWLSVSVAGKTASGGSATFVGTATITVSVAPGSLVSGNYVATLRFSAGGKVLVVPVLFDVFPTGSISTDRFKLTFNGTASCGSPIAPARVNVTNVNTTKPNPNVQVQVLPAYVTGNGWLQFSAPAGTITPFSFNVGIDTTGLAAQTYTAYVVVDGGTIGADNIPVTLTLSNPSTASIASDGVINGASFVPTIAPNAWVAIKGSALGTIQRTWVGSDFINGNLPTSVEGVSVTINGKPAYVEYVSACQINVFSPPDTATGQVPVVVAFNGTPVATGTAVMQTVSPAFFLFDKQHAIATHLDYTLVGASQPGFTPAKAGETIVLWASGFGPTVPATPAGTITGLQNHLATTVSILVDGVALPASSVLYAGLGVNLVGVYQFNIKLPTSLANGEHSIQAQINGQSTQANLFITIQN